MAKLCLGARISMTNVEDEGLKAHDQDYKGQSIALSVETWLGISLSGLMRHFMLRDCWMNTDNSIAALLRQLLVFSDRCDWMPFCLKA